MDPYGIITIIGLAVAVYATYPIEKRLDLVLRFSIFDRVIIALTLLSVHYIIYLPVLETLGFYIYLGPWKYGFNESNTIYLIFLSLSVYIFIRMKSAKVTRSNIDTAYELFETLLLENKYSELTLLVKKHIQSIIEISGSRSLRNSIAGKIKPRSNFHTLLLEGKTCDEPSLSNKLMVNIYEKLIHDDKKPEVAANILRRLVSNYGFVNYISIAQPYLGIDIIKSENSFTRDFISGFISCLIENPNSIYYYELENTQNLTHGHRYYISDNNKFLYFFLGDINIAKKLSIYKPIGDKVCFYIENDTEISSRFNRSLGTYVDHQRFKCPIYSSMHFFDIMIMESIHNNVRWHMWLFYFVSFTKLILGKLNPSKNVDLEAEWPTPYHYTIYNIVTIMLRWLEESEYLTDKSQLYIKNKSLSHDNGSIMKSTALALGSIVYMVINSSNITGKFKIYILEIVCRYLADTKHEPLLNNLNKVLMLSILRDGVHNKHHNEYVYTLSYCFNEIDHCLIYELKEFDELISNALME